MSAQLAPFSLPRHAQDRAPRGHMGFSWARFMLGHRDRVTYRLFRRSIEGRVWMEARTFHIVEPRADVAAELWRMRIRLREQVDAVDFKTLGLVP
jgi:hypothetical protein